MYIGEFARLAGTTPKAVRLYEQLGLLPEPRRRGKYRVYRAEDLELSLIHISEPTRPY